LQNENNKSKTDGDMIADTNESMGKMGENIETQATSKLSMEFLDSVSFSFFLVVLSLQVITYFAIMQSRNDL
jgi:hypothetical protein